MIHAGENAIGGTVVTVVRRKAKRVIVRVKADGSVWLTVPLWRATLHDAEEFLRAKWDWVQRTRQRVLARPRPAERTLMSEELAALRTLLGELHAHWAERLGEAGVPWKLRRMKTRWGVCNWRERRVTYAALLAVRPREQVEYVVVHELTHLQAHDHGPRFKALMDERLPDWRERRKALR